MTVYHRKSDANQAAIVKALRKVGASVCILSAVGQGCPDLLVGHGGANYLLEIKDGSLPPSARKLTPDQEAWHAVWLGEVEVVKDIPEALAAIGIQVAQ